MAQTKQTVQRKPQKQPQGAIPALLTTEVSLSSRCLSVTTILLLLPKALTDQSFHSNWSQEEIYYSEDKDKEEKNDGDEEDELDDDESDGKASIWSDDEASSDEGCTCSHINSITAQALTDQSFHGNWCPEEINYSEDKDEEEENDGDDDDE